MSFDPTLAAFRFGTGLSPHIAPPVGVDDLRAELAGPDAGAALHLIPPFAQAAPSLLALSEAGRARNAAKETDGFDAAVAAENTLKDLARAQQAQNLAAEVARMVDAPVGLRERLVLFWSDHFTVKARNGGLRHLVSPFVEEAIRPHLSGRFAEMLIAVTLHPMMLMYLQQVQSIGPNSPIGLRQGRGLNENLARELLELHTLGVDGPYGQTDVTQMAEMLAGLTYDRIDGIIFNARRAEPGAETVLGKTYSDASTSAPVLAALEDLAVHPATAAHIARKLAVHFVSDRPDPVLVDALTTAFTASGGDLSAVYDILLTHPLAWSPERQKVRTPQEYIASSIRALGVAGAEVTALTDRDIRGFITGPLSLMGQPWQNPLGPDGWPELPSDWIIPQTMAARISWAMGRPARLRPDLPDPREFVLTALGPDADPAVVFAAGASESRRDGVAVILSSAAFQRR